MDKKTLVVILVLIVLIAIIFITFKLNQPSRELQKDLLDKAELLIISDNQEIIVNIDDIKSIGEETFEAVLDTSSTKASIHTYNGVQLKELLSNLTITLNNNDVIILSGVDSFAVAYSGEEVLKDENVYIAYMEDGKYLGTLDNGGTGPYEVIVKEDQFSNRRCKWLTKIEVRR